MERGAAQRVAFVGCRPFLQQRAHRLDVTRAHCQVQLSAQRRHGPEKTERQAGLHTFIVACLSSVRQQCGKPLAAASSSAQSRRSEPNRIGYDAVDTAHDGTHALLAPGYSDIYLVYTGHRLRPRIDKGERLSIGRARYAGGTGGTETCTVEGDENRTSVRFGKRHWETVPAAGAIPKCQVGLASVGLKAYSSGRRPGKGNRLPFDYENPGSNRVYLHAAGESSAPLI